MENPLKILYNQCLSLQKELTLASEISPLTGKPFVWKYNELRTNVIKLDTVAKDYCNEVIEDEEVIGYAPTLEAGYIVAVKVELGSLMAYLDEKVNASSEFTKGVVNLIKAHLRQLVRDNPTLEKQIQDKVEDILNIGGYQFSREKVTIPYSSKMYIPDFTIDNQNLALEVKFCDNKDKATKLIDQINADITAYKTCYKNIIFIVYDMAAIRDIGKFCQGISDNSNVVIEVIKH